MSSFIHAQLAKDANHNGIPDVAETVLSKVTGGHPPAAQQGAGMNAAGTNIPGQHAAGGGMLGGLMKDANGNGIPDIAESFLGGRGGNTGTGVHQQSAGVPASSGGGIKGMLMKDANGNGVPDLAEKFLKR